MKDDFSYVNFDMILRRNPPKNHEPKRITIPTLVISKGIINSFHLRAERATEDKISES